MKTFRKVIFWIHLCCGVTGGIVIFTMCVTGALLAFEKNIIENVEHDQRFIAAGEHRLSVREILGRVVEAKPETKPSNITVQADPAAAVLVALGRDGQVFVDPYTGTITGEGNRGVRGFFRTVTDLHRYIALSGDGRPVGKAITGACNLMFLFLAMSGFYIWMPRRFSWQHLRRVIWFRGGLAAKARDFNWHNTIGFWSSGVLIVLTVTAAVISYQWAGNLVYTLTGNEVPRQQQQPPAAPTDQPFMLPENLNELWAAAATQTDAWRSIALRLPVAKEAVFTIDEGKSLNIFGRSTLTLDAATATVAKWEPYEQRNQVQQIRSWMRFMHTGESFGIIGQIVGFIACLGGAFLVFTGLSLAVRRLSGWLRGRAGTLAAF